MLEQARIQYPMKYTAETRFNNNPCESYFNHLQNHILKKCKNVHTSELTSYLYQRLKAIDICKM
jgi:hypothetical protein